METLLSHPSPAVFFGLLFCTLILGLVLLATIIIGLRRRGPKLPAVGPTPQPRAASAAGSGAELLGMLRSAVVALQAQEPGTAGYSQQLLQVLSLLETSAGLYPASASKIQAWSHQLRESAAGDNRNLLVLTEIHGWTRQQPKETA